MQVSCSFHRIVLVASLSLPGCVDAVTYGEDSAAITIPLEDPALDDAPHELDEESLDADGEVAAEALPCGLSVIHHEHHTQHWIRNCADYKIHAQLITLMDGSVHIGDTHEIAARSLVSGTVRGRVVRLKRR